MASNGKKIILCLVQIANIRADELEKKKKNMRGEGQLDIQGLRLLGFKTSLNITEEKNQ